MTGNQALIARTALSVVTGISSVASVSSSSLRRLSRKFFDQLAIGAFVLSRLAVYLGLFFVLRIEPRGDIPAYYWYEANSVLSGLLPYRDFPSSYAPLHPYLDGLLIRIWYSPLSIILFALCAELMILPVWLRIGRTFLSEGEVRTGALLYLTSAISLQFVAIDGQDNVIIATLLGLALLLVSRSRSLASGAAVGISAASIKFLPLLYAPAFLLAAPRRRRWVAGFALPVLVVYGAFTAKHLPVLSVLAREGGLKSANNLPFLIEGVLGVTIPSPFWDGMVVCAIAIILLLAANAMRRMPTSLRLRTLTFFMAALTLAIVLLSKKSWPPYLMLALFPICLLVPAGSKLKSTAFAVFAVAAMIGPSYWATVLSQFSAQEFHKGLIAHQRNCLIFLILQSVLVVGYSCLLVRSIRLIITSSRPAPATEVSVQFTAVQSA